MYTRCDYCNSDRALPTYLLGGKHLYMCLDCRNLLDNYVNKKSPGLLNEWSRHVSISRMSNMTIEESSKIIDSIVELRDLITIYQLAWLSKHRQ